MNACLVRWIRFTAGSLLATTVLAGCDLGGPVRASLRLFPDTAVLPIHQRLRLTVVASGVPSDMVAFGSSDTSRVTVDLVGNANAVGFGVAYVQAWSLFDSQLRDSVRVRVPEPAGPWLVLRPDSLSVLRGTVARLTWRLGGTADTAVQLRSSDTTIATVSDGGWVCAYRLGRVVIRATVASEPAATDSSHVAVTDGGPIEDGFGLPSASIDAIVDSAGRVVDLQAVRGTIRITARLETPVCAGSTTASLFFDGVLWQTMPDEIPPGSTVTRSFTADTRATNGAGQRLLPNGQHTLGVGLRLKTGTIIASTSQVVIVANP